MPSSEDKKYLIAPQKHLSNFINAEVNLEKLPFFFPYKNSKKIFLI
jgi:hypothetical protein